MPRPSPRPNRPNLPGHGQMEDFTNPFLVSFGIMSFVALFALWVIWGLAGAVFVGWVCNRAILLLRK